jgi:adenosylcobinamide kinase/adenosylcobinamide-phosphate guanylyltransferase
MRILLTGGSGSGKSTYAENLARKLPAPRYYIATMRPYDEECRLKIHRHRQQRESGEFITIERQTDVQAIEFPARGTAILECICNLLANEMFDERGEARDVYDKIRADIEALAKKCDTLILVTNEVGGGTGEYTPEVLCYIETLGQINRSLAASSDYAAELVCGIPLVLKGELPL